MLRKPFVRSIQGAQCEVAQGVQDAFGALGLERTLVAAVFTLVERRHHLAYIVSDCFHIAKVVKNNENFHYFCIMLLNELYKELTGEYPYGIQPLTPAGSNRRYYRLSGPMTVVGVEGVDRAENDAFIYLSRHFSAKGLPVPAILAVSADGMSYLVDDLGDTQLLSMIDDWQLLHKTVAVLARLHYVGSQGIDFSRCFPVEAFDRRAVMWDLNYFKYSFLNTSGVPYSEPRLEEDFRKIADTVEGFTMSGDCFMMRDFQSRNVMIKDGEPYLIDYQGGRRGPAAYDLASFLWQAKAGFTPGQRARLTDVYIEEARKLSPSFDSREFLRQLRLMTLLRTLQVLGAYGLRGRFERKSHFLQSIPPAIANLKTLLADGVADEYPYLKDTLLRLAGSVKSEDDLWVYEGLTLRVNSFSYKKGIPEDPSGNGGGFVFDCRAMENPGRYPEYKNLTGLDLVVIEFLERKGEIVQFLDCCYSLVDRAVENYLSRGFKSLMVSFGCTGGQHRSVYSAQHLAEHIKTRYPQVRVALCHREQNIRTVL